MRCTLWEKPIRQVAYAERIYRLNTAFRRVLQCFTVMDDPVLSEYDKIDFCLELLIRQYRFRAWRLSTRQRIELFEKIFRELVDAGTRKSGTGDKAFDFNQDAGYIYAAFAQCYGMDLLGKDRNLHWWKFIQLLGGLSEDTRLMQIISIRTRPMPKPTKYNIEERQNLLRLKGIYRLKENEAERQRRLQDGLRRIAIVMEGMARGKD